MRHIIRKKPTRSLLLFFAAMFVLGAIFKTSLETFAHDSQPRRLPQKSPKRHLIQGKNVGVYLEDADFGIQAPQFEYDSKRFLVDIRDRENNDHPQKRIPEKSDKNNGQGVIQTLRYNEMQKDAFLKTSPKSNDALKKIPGKRQPKKLTATPTSFNKTCPTTFPPFWDADAEPICPGVSMVSSDLFEEEISFESLSNESLIRQTDLALNPPDAAIQQVSNEAAFLKPSELPKPVEPLETTHQERLVQHPVYPTTISASRSFLLDESFDSEPNIGLDVDTSLDSHIDFSYLSYTSLTAPSQTSDSQEEPPGTEQSTESDTESNADQTSNSSTGQKRKPSSGVRLVSNLQEIPATPLYVSKELLSVPEPEPQQFSSQTSSHNRPTQYTQQYHLTSTAKNTEPTPPELSQEDISKIAEKIVELKEKEKVEPKKTASKGSPLAWSKGDFTITPYGYVNLSAAWESKRTVAGDYCVYAQSPELNRASDRNAFYVDPRSSRIGVRIDGLGFQRWSNSYSRGVFECDFQGKYEWRNRSDFLMRKAYIEVGDPCTKFLFGQDWEIVSPLFPNIFNYPAGSGVGNLGYRRAMARVDRKFDLSRDSSMLWQFAVCDNTIRDSLVDGSLTASGLPVFQGRFSYKFGEKMFSHRLPVVIGVSGQYGVQKADHVANAFGPQEYGKSHKTWVVCLDFDVPITKRLQFQAELYTGENLSNLEGGIIQGVDSVLRDEIRCRGGWFTFVYQWTKKMKTNVGFAIEDPYNQDLLGTGSVGTGVDRIFTARTYSHSIFGNVMYNWSEAFMTGVELSQWKTHWQKFEPVTGTASYLRPGEPFRIECVARYTF